MQHMENSMTVENDLNSIDVDQVVEGPESRINSR